MTRIDAPSTAPASVVSGSADRRLRWGSGIMAAAGLGFIAYAVIFFIRNFTDSFLELGIGQNEVDVGKDAIREFSPSLYHYISHLHIAVSGFIAAAGLATAALAWFGVRRGQVWALGGGGCDSGSRTRRRTAGPLPQRLRYAWSPGADLCRHGALRRRRRRGAACAAVAAGG